MQRLPFLTGLLPELMEVVCLFSSIIVAWLAVLFTVLSAVLYFVKRSGNRRLRRVFSKIHIAAGVLLIVTGIIHGILAGNMADATISDMTVAPVLFTLNWGTLSLIAAILLAVSYILRRKLKRRWMVAHRILTVALIALVILHVSDVGIQLDDRIQAVSYAETMTVAADIQEEQSSTVQADTSGVSASSNDTAATASTDSGTAAYVATANTMFSGATLIDGVYEGTATGYNGNITVSVTVLQGLVTDIAIVSENDTRSYFNRATTVINTIVDGQSLEVDAVSGATYSSAGIVNAVADALSGAVDSGTLAVTEFTYSQSKHGGPRN
ncbi:MAG: FMN-binding protein [Eubacteriales bacterium]|nr:FMN-binding protein [Eubacteriales bacterium]